MIAEAADSLVAWLRSAGPLGVLAYAGAYAVATLVLFPGMILTAVAGAVYGPWLGLAIALPVRVLAALGPYAVARFGIRERLRRRAERRWPKVAAVDAALAEGGLTLCVLIRISSLFPYNLTNYWFGSMRVRARDFVIAAFVGLAPSTVRYVLLGSVLETLRGIGDAGAEEPLATGLTLLGFAATIVVSVWIARIARRKLDATIESRAAVTAT